MNSINKQNVANISLSKPTSKSLLQPIISTAASRAKETISANTVSNFSKKVNKT
jgi:hypothetical protein